MKFGVHSPSWFYGDDPHEIFEGIKRKAQYLDTHGYAWLSVMDHLIQIPIVGRADEPFMEGWTVLSALAAVTSKLRLATLVSSVAYRNPALLAKMAAGVDIISRGRLTLGLGAGWHEPEYKQYNWEFPPKPATRIGQLEDAVRLIKAMWTQSRTTYHGKYFKVEDAILEPKPVQKPHPPIMIGGSGEQLTLRVVARVGTATNLFGDPETIKHKYDVLKQHCEKEGRNYDEIERTNQFGNLLLARTEAELKAKRARLQIPDSVRLNALTPVQAIAMIGQYERAGTQMVISTFVRNDQESLELFTSDVKPLFT
ncbi:MAG: TIGR03560 family F420-dependent LLM class oxidoreductase [Chloroflexi bacterium]|nr:TIGR03560 family F420-dependent LLM class oxidoreductase [Chloroflexota bacterium]